MYQPVVYKVLRGAHHQEPDLLAWKAINMEQRNKHNEQITTTRMYFDLPSFVAWVLSIMIGSCIFYLLVGGELYYLQLSALPWYLGFSVLPLGQVWSLVFA